LTFSALVVAAGAVLLALNMPAGTALLSAGCVCLVLVGVTWPMCAAVRSNRLESNERFLQPLTERLDQLAILLNLMSEQQLLSDRAISIAYREKDRDALSRAVHEEMGRHDWDAALSLVDEMERAFGNKAEQCDFARKFPTTSKTLYAADRRGRPAYRQAHARGAMELGDS